MALGALKVRIGGEVSGFRAALAETSAMAGSWSKAIGPKIDRAFNGLSKSGGVAKGITATLDGLSKFTSVSRAALAIGDVKRGTEGAVNSLQRLRLAFTFNADKASALREKVNATSSRLATLADQSEKARFALFAIDLAGFTAKLAVVAERAIPGLVVGVGRGAVGLASLASGVVRTAQGFTRFVPNVAGAAGALWKASDASKSFAARSADVAKALYHSRQAFRPLLQIGGGFSALAHGAANLAGGVLGIGRSFASIAFNTVVSGASSLLGVFSSLASTVASLATGFTLMGGLVAGGLTTFLVKAASGAAHLNETFNKARQTFGDFGQGVIDSAKEMQAAFGTMPRAFLDGASALGQLLKGVGYTVKDSAKLGTNLAKLAADMSAFRDISFDEALGKIRSGLSGESEPLKALGILIDDETTKLYAYKAGIAAVGKELTQAEKVQARLGLITSGLKDDMGALAREATGPAARINEFWGRLDALTNAVGETFAPILGEFLSGLNTGLDSLKANWEANSAAVFGWFGTSAEALSSTGMGLRTVTSAVGKLGESFAWLATQVVGALGSALRFTSSLVDHVSEAVNAIGIMKEVAGGAGAGDSWFNSASSLRQQGKAMEKFAQGFDLKATEWKEWGETIGESIGSAMETSAARIGERVQAMTKALDFTAAKPKNPLEKPASYDKSPFSGAYELGSKEAYSVIANSFGLRGKGGGAQDKTAANTLNIYKEVAKLNRNISARRDLPVVGIA